MRLRSALPLLLLALLAGRAAALTPDQIAIVFNKNNTDSQIIAAYYMRARNIPRENLIALNLTSADENISEVNYRTSVVDPIRDALTKNNLAGRIKCLVTTYGVPLKIGAQKVSPAEEAEIRDLRQQIVEVSRDLIDATHKYEAILNSDPLAGATPPPVPPPSTSPASTNPATTSAAADVPELPPPEKIAQALYRAINAASTRVNQATGLGRLEGYQQFLALHETVTGLGGMIETLRVNPNASDAAKLQQHITAMVGQMQHDNARCHELATAPTTAESRTETRTLRREMYGQLGLLTQLVQDVTTLRRVESESCLDNELMMLWIPNYPRARYLTNPYNIESWITSPPPKTTPLPNVLLVSRLDGANSRAVTGMIDQTLKTEAVGLDGVVYLDARGLRSNDDYARFDHDIVEAAGWLHDNTDLKVVLDQTGALFQAKDCPNCALYCGWYSVGTYVDSCQWLPGSVAYHVASFEMVTLHDPKASYWVPNLLKRGVCATMGPTAEPYLSAFPKPSLFFPLLLTGKWTVGEVYFMTTPNVSWRLGLVADPLYNPFAKRPRVTLAQLQLHPILRHAVEIIPVQ